MYWNNKTAAFLTETPKFQIEKLEELEKLLKDYKQKNQLKNFIEPLIALIEQTDDSQVFYKTVILLREMYRSIVTDQKMEMYRPDVRASISAKIKMIETGIPFKLRSKILAEITEALRQLGYLCCTKM